MIAVARSASAVAAGGGVGQDVQALLADRVAADDADPVAALGDAVERRLDHADFLQAGGAQILEHLVVVTLDLGLAILLVELGLDRRRRVVRAARRSRNCCSRASMLVMTGPPPEISAAWPRS